MKNTTWENVLIRYLLLMAVFGAVMTYPFFKISFHDVITVMEE